MHVLYLRRPSWSSVGFHAAVTHINPCKIVKLFSFIAQGQSARNASAGSSQKVCSNQTTTRVIMQRVSDSSSMYLAAMQLTWRRLRVCTGIVHVTNSVVIEVDCRGTAKDHACAIMKVQL